MGHDVWLESLRRAASGNPGTLDRVLCEGVPFDALQQIGDTLLGVLELAGSDLSGVVDRLVEQLRERRWDGDGELADALDHVVGRSALPLRPLPVELDEVGEALSQQPGGENYLDLQTGTGWFTTMATSGRATISTSTSATVTRWLFLKGESSHDAYRDLQRFIATVDDHDLAVRLTQATEQRGAFGRFRSVLERDPAEVPAPRWHPLRRRHPPRHARSWLAGHGYQAPTRPPHRPLITGPERAIRATAARWRP